MAKDYSHLFPDGIMRCHYCTTRVFKANTLEAIGRPYLAATRDHTFPKSQGGDTWVVCCQNCNVIKAYDPYELYVAFMRLGGGNELTWERRKKAYALFRTKVIEIGLGFLEDAARMQAEEQTEGRDGRDD